MSEPQGFVRGARTALRSLRWLACVLVALAPAEAHEIGVGRVDLLLRDDGSYRLELGLDPRTTVQRLELARGEAPTPDLDPGALEEQLIARRSDLLAQLHLTADGVPQALVLRELAILPPVSGRLEARVRLEGSAPPQSVLRLAWSLPGGRYALAVRRSEAPTEVVETHWLEPGETSPPLRQQAHGVARVALALQYLALGFTHILPRGLDHILFVLGIFLLAQRWKPVLQQVTAFTVAHSITLGLAMYGVVSLPSRIVEPLIALSIVYVAVENVLRPRLTPGRVAIVFAFGLLHGLGFAGALRELALPRSQFLEALLSFNVGVELGQLTVLAAAFLLVATWAQRESWYRARVVVPASCAIALVGLFWTVQRLLP